MHPPVEAGQPSSQDHALGQSTRDHSFASLDLMRGLCALAVLIQHAGSDVSGTGRPVFNLYMGSFAVDVFMLISGFLMMWHYFERSALGEKWTDPRTFTKFYVRRFFRIAPLYYLLLVVSYLFSSAITGTYAENAHRLGQINVFALSPITVGNVLSHFTFVFGFIPRFVSVTNMPDWSIGLEMQFYLFFPFLAIFLVRSRFVVAVITLLLLRTLTWHFLGTADSGPRALGYYPYPTLLSFKIDTFLTGMLLAAGLYDMRHPTKSSFLFILALAVSGFYMKKFMAACLIFLVYELAVNASTGIPAIDQAVGRAKKFVSASLFKFMANASYGVYLIHGMILTFVVSWLCKYPAFVHLSPPARLLISLAAGVPVIYATAHLLFLLVENPGIAVGRKIVKKMSGRTK